MKTDPDPRLTVPELRRRAITVAEIRRALLHMDGMFPISHLALVSPDEPNGAGLPPAGADLAEHTDDTKGPKP